jgi:hypothetical protein
MIGEALAVAAHALGADAAAVLARIGGAVGVAARAAAGELAALDPRAARRRRAEWAAIVRAPVPAGLRAIDPTWIEAALAELPPRARAAVAHAGGVATAGPTIEAGSAAESQRGSIDVWLARTACAEL